MKMVIQTKAFVQWRCKLAWSLPLFFLLKGLAWLALPVIYAFYELN
jgi:hypothetical protein